MSVSYTDFIKNNVAPYAAQQIGVYNSSGTRVGYIPLGGLKPDYGERLYRFGFVSDVHNETSQADENSDDLINALTYFNEKEDVEFVCISGDLTQTSYSTNDLATEMALYQSNLNSANIGKTIYVTTGNHDCPQSSDVNISTFYQYAGLSDIAPSSDAEYSYEVTKTHTTSEGTTVTDHFLFLTMKRYEFTTNTYSSTDITWLGNKLEEYKDDRCFVITHMFFPTYAGNLNDIYPSGNWLSGTMLTQLKALIDAYPHSIWFSGHSHWKWYLQKYQDRANIYPTTNVGRTTGWAVHMPSCASPIDSDGTTRVVMATQSEGAVIDVYEDYIDVRGIEFKGASDSGYAQRYIPIGQYRLYNEPSSGTSGGGGSESDTTFTSLLDNWQLNSAKKNSGDTLSDDIIITSATTDAGVVYYTLVKFDESSEGFILGNSAVTSGVQMTVTWDALSITNSAGTSISTSELVGIGFYDATDTSESNNYGYSLSSPFTTSSTTSTGLDGYYGVQLNTSSKASASTVTLSDGVWLTFTNIQFTISGVSDGGGSESGGEETETTKDTLIVLANKVSAAVGLSVSSTNDTYIKYDGIKITTADGTDITSTITSVGSSSSNSYKVGIYNSSGLYEYEPAGTVVTAQVNSTYSILPLVQASSSSNVASTNLYIQLKGLKYSTDQTTWTDINSNTTLTNGSSWGKNDLTYVWNDDIVDDPTTLVS